MTDYATQLVAAKMQQLNSRLNARMQAITDQTGIEFSEIFTQRLNSASQVDEASNDILTEGYVEGEQGLTETADETSRSTGSQRGGYDSLVTETAKKYGLNNQLIKAVMWAESNFNTNAVSSAGAMGLMQLMPSTAQMLGVNDAFDPAQNIDGGARYLAESIEKYGGDVLKALAAYNCGAGGLSSRGISDLTDPEQFAKLPKETQTYLTRIEGYLESAGVSDILA